MKKMKSTTLFALPLSAMVVMTACGDNGEDTADEGNGNNNENNSLLNENEDQDNATNQDNADNELNEGNLEDELEGGMNEEDLPEMEEFELDMDPDEPVAIVNDEEITAAELEETMQMQVMQAQMQGQQLTDEQLDEMQEDVIDFMVDNELMERETEGLDLSDEEREEAVEELENFVGEDINALLEEQGVPEEEQEEIIDQEAKMFHLVGNVELDDDDVQDYYEETAGGQEGQPQFDELEDEMLEQIEFQLKQERLAEELRDDADVEILV